MDHKVKQKSVIYKKHIAKNKLLRKFKNGRMDKVK